MMPLWNSGQAVTSASNLPPDAVLQTKTDSTKHVALGLLLLLLLLLLIFLISVCRGSPAATPSWNSGQAVKSASGPPPGAETAPLTTVRQSSSR